MKEKEMGLEELIKLVSIQPFINNVGKMLKIKKYY
jgi:hypothetical protein